MHKHPRGLGVSAGGELVDIKRWRHRSFLQPTAFHLGAITKPECFVNIPTVALPTMGIPLPDSDPSSSLTVLYLNGAPSLKFGWDGVIHVLFLTKLRVTASTSTRLHNVHKLLRLLPVPVPLL